MFFAALCNCYALNFFSFLGALPSRTFSAPTFLPPLSPQPYLFLLNKLQEERINAKKENRKMFRIVFMNTICIKIKRNTKD